MNRLGVQNFVVDLTKEMEFQLMGAYVIYQTSDGLYFQFLSLSIII